MYDLADVFYYYLNPDALPAFPDRHGKRPAHMIALGRTAAQAPGSGADKRAKTRPGQTASSAASASSSAAASGGIWAEGGEGEEGAAQQPVEMTVAYFKEGSTREVRTDLADPEVLADALEGRYWEAKQGEVFMGTFQVGGVDRVVELMEWVDGCMYARLLTPMLRHTHTHTPTYNQQVDDPRFVPLEDRSDVMAEDKVEVNVLARYYPFTNYRVRTCTCMNGCMDVPRPRTMIQPSPITIYHHLTSISHTTPHCPTITTRTRAPSTRSGTRGQC